MLEVPMSRFSLALLTTVLACASSGTEPQIANATGSAMPTKPPVTDWSPVKDGLRIRFDLPAHVKRDPPANGASQPITATMHVENTTDHPIRILLLQTEAFRLFNSSLRIWHDKDIVGSDPEPHPHGHMTDENDFVLIAPHKEHAFTQNFYVTKEMAAAGTYDVEWEFANKIKSYPGGVRTFDGMTKPLFGGGDIPDIWLGELSVRRSFTLD
jgi:hypothetical protein